MSTCSCWSSSSGMAHALLAGWTAAATDEDQEQGDRHHRRHQQQPGQQFTKSRKQRVFSKRFPPPLAIQLGERFTKRSLDATRAIHSLCVISDELSHAAGAEALEQEAGERGGLCIRQVSARCVARESLA